MAKKEIPTLKDVARVPEELQPVVAWWQDHGPRTLAWAVAALAVCVGLYVWHGTDQAQDAAAAVALAQASDVEGFEGVVAMGTEAAPLARLALANALYTAGDAEGALAAYDASLAELDDPAVRDIAAVGRVCALEALGRLDAALAEAGALEAAFGADPARPHYLTPALTLAKARLLCQKGDKAAGKAALAPLLDAPEGSPLAAYKAQAERTVKMIDAYAGPKSLFDQAAAAEAEAKPAPEAPAAPAK